MKLRPSSYSLIAIMVIALAFIVSALRLEYFESKLLPLLFGSAVLILAAVELGQELRARAKPGDEVIAGEEAGTTTEAGVGARSYLIAGGWIVGFFLGILMFGFVIGIVLFVFSYMKTHGTRWLVAAIFAVVTTAVLYGVFDFLLGVDLYQGLIFRWLSY
ncbi:tripartite tricarboxylate transporter TctB family protein [Chloroflexota bacterium]